jgi:hypothetical protein
MPITYDEATDVWSLTEASEAEQKSLIKIATDDIVSFFGDSVAQNIISMVNKRLYSDEDQPLEDMDKENMFNA